MVRFRPSSAEAIGRGSQSHRRAFGVTDAFVRTQREWQAPRILRRAGTSAKSAAPGHQPRSGEGWRDRQQSNADVSQWLFANASKLPGFLASVRAGVGVVSLIASLLGAATGAGGAYLLVLLAPAAAGRVIAPVKHAVTAIGGTSTSVVGVAGQKNAPTGAALLSLSPPSAGDDGRPFATSEAARPGSASATSADAAADGSERSLLLQKAERELAERKLEQPAGDNALESYRLLAAKWPQERRVTELGGAIGAAFWSLGNNARAAGNWQDALHYLEIVNTLPPLPLATLASTAAKK